MIKLSPTSQKFCNSNSAKIFDSSESLFKSFRAQLWVQGILLSNIHTIIQFCLKMTPKKRNSKDCNDRLRKPKKQAKGTWLVPLKCFKMIILTLWIGSVLIICPRGAQGKGRAYQGTRGRGSEETSQATREHGRDNGNSAASQARLRRYSWGGAVNGERGRQRSVERALIRQRSQSTPPFYKKREEITRRGSVDSEGGLNELQFLREQRQKHQYLGFPESVLKHLREGASGSVKDEPSKQGSAKQQQENYNAFFRGLSKDGVGFFKYQYCTFRALYYDGKISQAMQADDSRQRIQLQQKLNEILSELSIKQIETLDQRHKTQLLSIFWCRSPHPPGAHENEITVLINRINTARGDLSQFSGTDAQTIVREVLSELTEMDQILGSYIHYQILAQSKTSINGSGAGIKQFVSPHSERAKVIMIIRGLVVLFYANKGGSRWYNDPKNTQYSLDNCLYDNEELGLQK